MIKGVGGKITAITPTDSSMGVSTTEHTRRHIYMNHSAWECVCVCVYGCVGVWGCVCGGGGGGGCMADGFDIFHLLSYSWRLDLRPNQKSANVRAPAVAMAVSDAVELMHVPSSQLCFPLMPDTHAHTRTHACTHARTHTPARTHTHTHAHTHDAVGMVRISDLYEYKYTKSTNK